MARTNSDKRSRQARAEQMRKERERAEARRRNIFTVVIVAIVVVLIAVAGFAIKSQVDENNAPAATPSHVAGGVGIVYDHEVATGEPAKGDPVEVVLYEDFQCPACRAFEQANGKFLEKKVEQGVISIEYRPIAFLDQMSTTNYSTRALNAAACVLNAEGVKAFHKMHGLLFANQPPEGGDGLPDSKLVALAEQAGASGVESCITDGTYESWAAEVTQKASEAGVSATPTVLVAGEEVSGPTQNGQPTLPRPQDLKKAIQAAK